MKRALTLGLATFVLAGCGAIPLSTDQIAFCQEHPSWVLYTYVGERYYERHPEDRWENMRLEAEPYGDGVWMELIRRHDEEGYKDACRKTFDKEQ